ncbi:GumC family protein [Sphingomonas sp. DT-204]|uniref:GumC family protein n=1 Tax=Sphingomonas sp. DT-204 TaxID=3396166 RepID=UPI003F1D1C73
MNVLIDQQDAATTGREAPPLALEYLRIAKRWKFVIAGTILGFLLAGLIVTLLMTPKYTATTQLEIARESNKIVNLQGVEQEASDADQEFYQTQYGLLRSQSLAERVASKLRLDDDPAFFAMFGEDPADYGGQSAKNGRFVAADRGLRTRLAGDILLKNMSVTPTRLSRLVDISVTTPSATLSARIANAWAENFIQATLERRYEATSYARNFLENRLEQLRRRLEDSERQLVTYASTQRIINLPNTGGPSDSRAERSIVADNLASLNGELARATADRVKAQARYDQLRARGGDSAEALDNSAINVMRAKRAELAADYQKLATQFEPGYPAARALQSQIDQLDRSIAREERRVSGSLGSEYRSALEREQALSNRVEGLKASLIDLRRRSIQYNIYQREVDTNRALYDGLLQRYKEIGITGGVGVNNISVVDTASTPDRRSSPKLLLNLLLSVILGTIVGAGLALLFEHIDESIMDPADVRQRLGVPLLGTVPWAQNREPTEALRDRKSELFDAYLAVQANLKFATDHGLPRTLSVTSTRPSEGKSTTALSLATTLVRSGRSVVLVDGDMRSPSVHHLLGRGHEAGLSNYLAGNDTLENMLVKADQYGFTAMTAGPLPPNAAELLTSDRLAKLLEQLLTRFDHVVIDSPPVMGLADAPLIGNRVEAVIFVVESHGIRSRQVRTALERLADAGARVIGAVLTKFDARRAHVGYGYEYGYDYGRKSNAEA